MKTMWQCLPVFLLLLPGNLLKAQAYFQLYAGGGLPHASSTQPNPRQRLSLTTCGGAAVIVPIVPALALETGLSYTLKGWSDDNSMHWPQKIDEQTDFRARNRSHYLGVPLMLRFSHHSIAKGRLSLAVGMAYNFLLSGSLQRDEVTYKDGEEIDRQSYKIKLKQKIASDYKGNSLFANGFDVATRMQLDYTWKYGLGLRLFHEYSLYEYYQPTIQNNFKLRYTGLAIVWTVGRNN